MQTYINSKLVQATPMTRWDFYSHNKLDHLIKIDPENIDDEDGFLVEDTQGVSNHKDHKGRIYWLSSMEFLVDHIALGDISKSPAYQQRMLGELAQLNIKLKALQQYTKTDQFLKLAFMDRDLLQEQCRLMARYSDVLAERLLRCSL